MINSVGLIGVGRFGKVLGSILNKGFNVKAYDVMPSNISADFEEIHKKKVQKILFSMLLMEELI